MACIAGTVSNPKVWYTKDGMEVLGRRPTGGAFCPRLSDGTSVRSRPRRVGRKAASCNGCPCYRGMDAFGVVADGYTPDRRWVVSFTAAEYEAYLDGEWEGLVEYKEGRQRAASTMARYPREAFTDAELEVARAYDRERARRWRAEHPGADKRNRAEYRRQQRMCSRHVPTVPCRSVTGGSSETSPPHARARGHRQDVMGTGGHG